MLLKVLKGWKLKTKIQSKLSCSWLQTALAADAEMETVLPTEIRRTLLDSAMDKEWQAQT